MKSRHFINFMLLVLSLALAPTVPASTIWYVNGVNGSDSNSCTSPASACKSIGNAISRAASGDTIMVAAATYPENLTIGKNLTLIGSSATTTIIDGGGRGTVVTIWSATGYVAVTLSQVTIRNGYTVTDNTGFFYGGGIYNAGNLTIDNSTLSGNVTQCFRGFGCASWGGGIYNTRSLTINNSTITGNSAIGHGGSQGGGIYSKGVVRINNSTITGNSADHGGGIYNYSAELTINSSTISGNRATLAGGNIVGSGTIYGSATLQDSIVANSLGGGNCSGLGRVTSNGYNLSSDATCNFTGPGDLNNTDPKLGPLQNNGGPTETQALLSGSPAIDAGDPNGCTDSFGNLLKTDQRGMPRPDREDNVGCDMGAYESQSD